MSQDHDIHPALPQATWRASSHSGGQGDCLEVADNLPTHIPVRDTKHPTGPTLTFSPDVWTAFVNHLR